MSEAHLLIGLVLHGLNKGDTVMRLGCFAQHNLESRMQHYGIVDIAMTIVAQEL